MPHHHPARLLTYNIHAFVGRDRRFSPERTGEVIADIDADIVALQEVGSSRGRQFNGYQFFEETTDYHAIAGPTRHNAGGPFGNLLLSRWPVVHEEVLDITVIPPFARTAIIAQIETPLGGRIRVVAAHLGLQGWERQRQLRMIHQHLHMGRSVPIIFMGDFNFWRGAHRLTLLDQMGIRAVGHPKTFPSHMPVWPLDQIRARPVSLLDRVAVVRAGSARVASDHLPLVADINLHKLSVVK